MKLPIATQSYQPTTAALVRAVKRARLILARTTADENALDGAVVITNPQRPAIRLANHAADLHLPNGDDAAAVLQRVFDHFKASQTPCHTLDNTDDHWPPAFIEPITQHGYTPRLKHVLLLRDYQPAAPRHDASFQIVPARALYSELTDFYHAVDVTEYFADAMINRLDEPRLELFIARLDGSPVAAAGVTTLGQIGVIEPAYALPAARGRGIAKALMHHTLEHCCRAQFEQVLIERTDGCPAIGFYESLGFIKAATYTKYVR